MFMEFIYSDNQAGQGGIYEYILQIIYTISAINYRIFPFKMGWFS